MKLDDDDDDDDEDDDDDVDDDDDDDGDDEAFQLQAASVPRLLVSCVAVVVGAAWPLDLWRLHRVSSGVGVPVGRDAGETNFSNHAAKQCGLVGL